MAGKRYKNAVLLAAIESTEGTEASIVAADALVIEALQVRYGDQTQQTNEHTGSLDPAQALVIGGPVTLTFQTWLKGSGSAGTAPAIGKLLRACGFTETLTAADVGAPTAALSGGLSSAVLPTATFSAAADGYNGMVARVSGNPATALFAPVKDWGGNGTIDFFRTFAATLTTSSLVAIKANARYTPQSGTIPSLTFHAYLDGVKHAILGARGSWDLTLEAGRPGVMSWTFSGILSARTDTANPTPTYSDMDLAKLVWRNDANNAAFLFDGAALGVQQLRVACGNAIEHDPNPNLPDGFDVADITGRDVSGSFNPKFTSIATRDTLTLSRAGTTKPMAAFMGLADGNRFCISGDAVQILAPNIEGQALLRENIGLRFTGRDTGARLCFF